MESLGDRCRLYFCFATGLFECLGFAGVINGWASLVFVLRNEEYFLDVCDTILNSSSDGARNVSAGCDLQDDRFTLVFTIASFAFGFSALPGGVLFDFVGTMVTRILAITFYTAATLMIALSTAASAALLFPALSLMAIGGIFLLITSIQVANLFQNRRSAIITLYNGAVDSSSVMFLLVKVLHEAGFSMMSIFLFISSLSAILILRTFLLLPITQIPYPLPERYIYGISCDTLALRSFCREKATPSQIEPDHGGESNIGEKDGTCDEMEGDIGYGQENMEEDSALRKEEKEGGPGGRHGKTEEGNAVAGSAGHEEQIPTLRGCISSKIVITQLFWLSIIQLRMVIFIGTLNPMLTQAANGDVLQVSRFTNAFAFTQLFGIFTAPWNGLIMDWHRRRTISSVTVTATSTSQRLADTKSAVLSLAITVTLGVLFSTFAAVPVLEVQYVTFVLQVLTRSFLFGGLSTFITIAFPPCHFGKIFDLTVAVLACVSLLQYPCLALVQGPLQHNPLYLNIGLIVLVTLTYVHPITVNLHCQREMRKRGVANSS
ncbi:equilibrative nucleobase transporter 1-like [Scyliorhinus torazame]|uniref:equilibrative nucleobase transporter 1-like n=1 Tax=Scyliorhinus torazame TaxID=75743 RepID=UPI003B5A613C